MRFTFSTEGVVYAAHAMGFLLTPLTYEDACEKYMATGITWDARLALAKSGAYTVFGNAEEILELLQAYLHNVDPARYHASNYEDETQYAKGDEFPDVIVRL